MSHNTSPRQHRARWAAIGAAVAISMGAGSLLTASAASPTASVLTTITPCRLLDTRASTENVGPRNTPLGAGDTYTALVHGTNGNCTIPASATGVSMNLSVVNGTAGSYLTVFPPDTLRPLASSSNWVGGQAPTPNAVTSKLSADGRLGLYNLSGTVDVIVDIVGYYETGTGAAGPAGPAGPAGVAGGQGPQGLSGWDTIPSGQTVSGSQLYRNVAGFANEFYTFAVPFPAKANGVPTSANFSADGNGATTDDDASCTGSAIAPTAPAGKVCLYLSSINANSKNANGGVIGLLSNTGFVFTTQTVGAGPVDVFFTWAYTAP